MLWTDRTTILIDCGIKTQADCHVLLARHVGTRTLDAVLVSHAHGDHICYSSLRVLGELGIPVHCHEEVIQQVHDEHIADWDSPPSIRTFSDKPFEIGNLTVQTVALSHAPGFPTFGFVLRSGRKKMFVGTDFNKPDGIAEHLADADFIFIEANHDLELLRQNWNPASRYHMNNLATPKLVVDARKKSHKPPQAVMLGHLSEERNRDDLAVGAVRQAFVDACVELDFWLDVAPRYEASRTIRID